MKAIHSLALDSRLARATVGKVQVDDRRASGIFQNKAFKKFDLVLVFTAADPAALAPMCEYDWAFAGVKTTLASPLTKVRFAPVDLKPDDFVRPGDHRELSILGQELSRESHFHRDPGTERLGKAVYKEWIKNSISGEAADDILVQRDSRGKAVGFITIKKTGGTFEPVLVKVSDRCRGRGYGKLLMRKFFSYVGQADSEAGIVIHAMLENPRAIRFYSSFGINPADFRLIFHVYPKGFRKL